MSGPLQSDASPALKGATRGRLQLVRRGSLAAAGLLLMLAPASSQTRGPASVAPVAEKLIEAVDGLRVASVLALRPCCWRR